MLYFTHQRRSISDYTNINTKFSLINKLSISSKFRFYFIRTIVLCFIISFYIFSFNKIKNNQTFIRRNPESINRESTVHGSNNWISNI